jgi:hypothetical protein
MTMPAATESTAETARGQGARRRSVRLPAPGRVVTVPVPALPRMPSLPKLPGVSALKQLELLKPQLRGIKLPPPERLAFYAAMGAMAVADVIEWPVALAILASQGVARRTFGEPPWERLPAERAGGAGAEERASQAREHASQARERASQAREASSTRPRRSPAAQRGRTKAAAPAP